MDNLDYNTASSWDKIKHSFRSWRYIGVGKSLLIWFLAISIVPLASISFINFLNAYHGLTVLAEKSLHSTSLLRVENIQSYFQEIVDFLELNSKQNEDAEFLQNLKSGFEQNNFDFNKFKNSAEYTRLTQKHQDEFKNISRRSGYHDIYFIDKEGNILFSIKQEADLGQNLFTSELNQTRFALACRQALDNNKITFSDLERYKPSLNMLSGFFAQPLLNQQNEIIGLIALQINTERFNRIIHQSAGYGETGQAYLIGQDLMLRSPLRFGQDSEVLEKMADNQKARDWVFYLQHRENLPFLKKHELEEEKVSSYDSDNQNKYVLGIYRNLTELEKLGVNWALIEEIEHIEAFAYARKLSDIVKISFIVTIIVVFLISILVTRWFVNPIKQLSSWGKQVAVGHLDNKYIKAPNNEVGEMVNTFNKLTGSLQSYASVAKSMARGDYSEQVEIRSDGDVLGKSMNQMVTSFRQVVEQANRIAKGDYEQTVIPRSEHDTLGISLYEMTSTLQHNRQLSIEQDWLKTGLNSLGRNISREKNLQELSSSVISFLVPYMNAQVGLMFLAEPDKNELHLKGHFAIEEGEIKKFKVVPYGSGLTGQVAQDRKVTTLNNIETHHKVRIGSEILTTRSYLACPLMYEDELIGVIELVSLFDFNELHTNFIKTAAESIAVAFVTAKADETVKKLLRQTQEQANELAVQQEELRQANEELQEQTHALRISEENLQSQQEELKVTNEELEERTRALELQRDAINLKNKELELARKEIEQKAKDLEQASRYKSEFLANMSHELRTPLNSILVLSQILAENRKKHLDNKELEYARTINSSGSDLLDLINEILDLSKVEAGKIDLFIESMYFDDLANYVRKTFGPLAEKKGLELFVNITNSVPQMIRTDAQRLYQIIKNLYSNAIKFTHDGSITLNVFKPDNQVNLQSRLNVGSTVAISVSDTGIGIPKDKLDLIFEAFRQADGTTSRKYGGTGLGLSISKGFAELLGGEIQVESEVGKGTTFTLFLPEEAQTKANEQPIQSAITENENKPSDAPDVAEINQMNEQVTIPSRPEKSNDDRDSITVGDKTLLVIEDDQNFSRLLYDLAHEHRYKCLIANDGESGLHLADYYQPHAIILDIGLPGIDGYEVINRLKNSQRTRHIPVHIISAADKSLDSLKLGAIGYLNKPVTQQSLEQAFSKIDNIVNKPLRTLLIIEDDAVTRKSIENLMTDDSIRIVSVGSAESALQLLENEAFDCIILDLGLVDMSGFEFLDIIKNQEKFHDIPVVVYTSKELNKDEDLKLQQYAESIIMKGARSFERLLSETTLFLHQIESELPEKKQKMLRKIHGREDILEGKTVLIVDDDMRNVFALNSLLESYKIKTINARNGVEGIKKLKETPAVDLILMDVMMPEMDGYEAMRIIRKESAYARLPIIALTAKAMKDDREKCMAAGASEYLAKPVESAKLISLLRVWLYK